jgi:hypothetical protein
MSNNERNSDYGDVSNHIIISASGHQVGHTSGCADVIMTITVAIFLLCVLAMVIGGVIIVFAFLLDMVGL